MFCPKASFIGILKLKSSGPVVPRVDSAIHWITQSVLLVFIRWILLYPVDGAIHLLNNRGPGVSQNKFYGCDFLGQ